MEDAKTEVVDEPKDDEKSKKEKKKRIHVHDITPDGASKAKDVRYTKRFFMKWTDEDDVVWEGEFKIKRPTIAERARLGTLLAELRDDKPLSSLDRNAAALHEWLAVCTICVEKAPPWFKPEEMYDSEPLQQVYLEALAFQGSFLKTVGE